MGGGGGGGMGGGFNRGPPDDKPSVLTIRHTAGKEKFKQVLVASNFTRYLERFFWRGVMSGFFISQSIIFGLQKIWPHTKTL